jgi:predicted extracellular nuclease
MEKLVYLCLLLVVAYACTGRSSDKAEFNDSVVVGFYNVENLFDTIDSPGVNDLEFTPGESKQWNQQRYQQKLKQLVSVMQGIGDTSKTAMPAVMGLCELENKNVLAELVNQDGIKEYDYQMVHVDSPDKRGIDVGLIYRSEYFEMNNYKAVPLMIYDQVSGKRIYTRDQLVVSGKLLGEPVHFIVNHWPSRYGGEERSRPLRAEAAKLTRSLVDSILKVDADANVVVMGDLNDDPENISVKEILNAVVRKDLQKESLYNPLAEQHTKDKGTLCYRGRWNMFDQLIVTQNLLDGEGGLKLDHARVYDANYLKVQSGKYKGYPLRTYVGRRYDGGYSDHFPVYMMLKKN